MAILYQVIKGVDIKPVGKSALHERALRIWQKGHRAQVKKIGGEYQLFVSIGALRAAGLDPKGRNKIKVK